MGVKLYDAARITFLPVAVEPVKNRWSNGNAEKSLASVASPVVTENSKGWKYSATIVARYPEVLRERSDGLSQTRLPAAIALIAGASAKRIG